MTAGACACIGTRLGENGCKRSAEHAQLRKAKGRAPVRLFAIAQVQPLEQRAAPRELEPCRLRNRVQLYVTKHEVLQVWAVLCEGIHVFVDPAVDVANVEALQPACGSGARLP